MADSARVKELFSQMSPEDQQSFVDNLSDNEAANLVATLKGSTQDQPTTEEPSFLENAASYSKNLAVGLGKQAIGVVPSINQGVNRTMGGILQTGAEGLEGMGLTAPGSAEAFTQQYNRTMLSNPYAAGEYRVPVGEFAGEVLPYMLAAPEALGARVVAGGVAGGTRYSEEGPVDPSQRAQEATGGAVLGAIAKPVTDVAVSALKFGIGGAKSIYNKILGRDDPYAPIHEAITPLTQYLTGTKQVFAPATTKTAADLAPQIKAKNDWMHDADAIQRITGKRPEILLSAETGSRRAAAAEGVVLKSSAADKALNQLTKIQDDAVAGVQHIGKGMRTQPVSQARAGAAIYNAHVKFETQLTQELEDAAAANYGRIRATFGDLPVMNYKITKKVLMQEAAEQADSGNFAAARSLKKMSDNLSNEYKTIEAVLNYRKLRARNARGVGSIAGLGREDTAAVASNIVKAINDDILEAGAAFGNPRMQEQLKLADAAYREGYTALRKARESTLGKIVNVQPPGKGVESINKRARLTAEPKIPLEDIAERVSRMSPSEFKATMKKLSTVDPMVERRVGRYLIDQSLKKSEVGGSRLETEATHNMTKLYDSLSENNAFHLIRDVKKREEAITIMRWIARSADRLGGGAPIDPLRAATKEVMATATLSPPFVIQAAGLAGLGPIMERALFTEGGRRAMKTIIKYPNVNPVLYQKAIEYMQRSPAVENEPEQAQVGPAEELLQ